MIRSALMLLHLQIEALWLTVLSLLGMAIGIFLIWSNAALIGSILFLLGVAESVVAFLTWKHLIRNKESWVEHE